MKVHNITTFWLLRHKTDLQNHYTAIKERNHLTKMEENSHACAPQLSTTNPKKQNTLRPL